MTTSRGTNVPPMSVKFVLTVEKNSWPREGARKPVLAAPRKTTRLSGWTRTVTLPSTVLPKSL